MVDGNSMIWFPLVIPDFEHDMTGVKSGPLGWDNKKGNKLAQKFWGASNYCPSVASDHYTDPKVVGSNPFIAVLPRILHTG